MFVMNNINISKKYKILFLYCFSKFQNRLNRTSINLFYKLYNIFTKKLKKKDTVSMNI
jgi:hypothetical protein